MGFLKFISSLKLDQFTKTLITERFIEYKDSSLQLTILRAFSVKLNEKTIFVLIFLKNIGCHMHKESSHRAKTSLFKRLLNAERFH